ncbi:hypothetical protein LPJ62_003648 [Coemansia sp. RSA 2167]|nr:hypothetical protein LPJ62_003648 [Coemansia sp. RSA 2167]KAJ2526031.1 hypothetical protein IWW43_006554 [Coemansia sp. RSA 1935]
MKRWLWLWAETERSCYLMIRLGLPNPSHGITNIFVHECCCMQIWIGINTRHSRAGGAVHAVRTKLPTQCGSPSRDGQSEKTGHQNMGVRPSASLCEEGKSRGKEPMAAAARGGLAGACK